MNEDSYEFTLSRTEYRYEFVSVSAKKEVKKVVLFSQTESRDIFNLALLDLLDDGGLSDLSETKNADLKVVLATVFKIIIDFLNRNLNCFVAFKGSDERRQRLYRITISGNLAEISNEYQVLGSLANAVEFFEPNKSYDYYIITKI